MTHPSPFVAVDIDALPWSRNNLPNGQPKGIQFRAVMNGGKGLPMVHESRYDPNWTEARHRHGEDEVLYLTEGELTVEDVVYRAPAAIFVARGTLYGPLTAGPQGAAFVRVGYSEDLMRAEPAAGESVSA